MKTKNTNPWVKDLKHDIPASIVVFLVALPLCLGIALASGAPLFSGVIAGIVGGLIVAPISRSALGVSGPAAGLVVIVIGAIAELGSFGLFLYAVIIAGVFQLLFGLIKAGVIAYYFPNSVIKGMLTAIGIIIILKQIPHVFGYDKDPEGDWAFEQADGHNTLSELLYMVDSIAFGPLLIAVISLTILIAWESKWIKSKKSLKYVQGPLVAVITSILMVFVLQRSSLAISSEHLVSLPEAGGLKDFIGFFTLPDFTAYANGRVYVIALTLAIVASLETLLCLEATDKLDPLKRSSPSNRELIAQGIGNIVSGFIGGLPITQVIVRSSANIQSGGRNKSAAFLHGLLLLICVISIPQVLNHIPLASLAAILLVVGYKLAKPKTFIDMYKKGQTQFVPFIVTVLGIVFTDLLIGVCLGLVSGFFHILWKNFNTPYHPNEQAYKEGEPIHIKLSEDVSFLNKARILRTLNAIPENAEVHLDASLSKNIDPDVLEIIEDFRENAKYKNIDFHFKWDHQDQG